MTFNFKILTIMFFCFASICFLNTRKADASSFNINIVDATISLKADNTPLIDIIKTVTAKTDITISVKNLSPAEMISCNCKKISIEECLRRLLFKHNYVIIYEKNEEGLTVLNEVIITEGIINRTNNTWHARTSQKEIEENSNNSHADELLLKYQRDLFKNKFNNTKKLLKQITAVPGAATSDGPIGIKIKSIAKDSFFRQLGITQGDVILDVNGGAPIKTSNDFIHAINNSFNHQASTLRIERYNADGQIDPIYIELY